MKKTGQVRRRIGGGYEFTVAVGSRPKNLRSKLKCDAM